MAEQAEQLYRRAVELAPADPQYREYLGEFLHIQKRPEEALVVWSGIAEGDRRNAVNMTRLAEVYNSFGFPEKAVVEIAEAVSQDPKDFACSFVPLNIIPAQASSMRRLLTSPVLTSWPAATTSMTR